MKNQELAKILNDIARYLYMDKVPFKPQAYEKVALSLQSMEQDVAELYKKGGREALFQITGVGQGLADVIEEYFKKGKIRIYEEYKKKLPVDLDELTRIEGLGTRKARTLYQKLKIKTVKDLEKAAKAHKIAPLFGFGEKTEKNILEGIDFLKRDKGRFLLSEILPTVRDIMEKLENLKEVKKISIAGSLRRMKETIGDADILVAVNESEGSAFAKASADAVADFFVSLPDIEKVWGKGSTKASIRMKQGFDIDLRIVPEKSYGAALQYFTGSKEHNIKTRIIAIGKGLKLNEYGLFRGSEMVVSKTEEDIYKAIGMPYIPPEIREDQGEFNLKKAPGLVELKDIKGDLHVHSEWDGGINSIADLAREAMNRGYEYIGISDHTKFLRIEYGLNEKELAKQREEIDKINEKFRKQKINFRVLQGCETNILEDGSVDIKDEALVKLDYVIAGVHSLMKMTKDEMMARITKAMHNPNIDIISHPTGRILKRRDEYQVNFDKIIKAAKETGTILEINASPDRLDLKDTNIRRAREAGVKMIINTDTHQKEQLGQMEYGIAQARRGWAEKSDIINTLPADKLLEYFK